MVSKEDNKDRAKLKQLCLIGILTFDFICKFDNLDGWASLSALEMFVFVSHRESLLSEYGISSVQLPDQAGESGHSDVARTTTNYKTQSQFTFASFCKSILLDAMSFEGCFNSIKRKEWSKSRKVMLIKPDTKMKFLIDTILHTGKLPNSYKILV